MGEFKIRVFLGNDRKLVKECLWSRLFRIMEANPFKCQKKIMKSLRNCAYGISYTVQTPLQVHEWSSVGYYGDVQGKRVNNRKRANVPWRLWEEGGLEDGRRDPPSRVAYFFCDTYGRLLRPRRTQNVELLIFVDFFLFKRSFPSNWPHLWRIWYRVKWARVPILARFNQFSFLWQTNRRSYDRSKIICAIL